MNSKNCYRNRYKALIESNLSILPEKIDEVFGDHPTASVYYYLGYLGRNAEAEAKARTERAMEADTDPSSSAPAMFAGMVTEQDQQKAFAYGYISALHKAHVYSPALLLHGDNMVRRVVEDTYGWLSDAQGELVVLTASGLKRKIKTYLSHSSKQVYTHIGTLSDAFITGYQTAFLQFDRYDRCLFMDGHVLATQIIGDLVAFDVAEENAQRACARIIVQEFGNPEQFRAALREQAILTNDGNLVPNPDSPGQDADASDSDRSTEVSFSGTLLQ